MSVGFLHCTMQLGLNKDPPFSTTGSWSPTGHCILGHEAELVLMLV